MIWSGHCPQILQFKLPIYWLTCLPPCNYIDTDTISKNTMLSITKWSLLTLSISFSVDFGCICWQLSRPCGSLVFAAPWFFFAKFTARQTSSCFPDQEFQVQVQVNPRPFMSLALYLKIRKLFGIGASLCFALFYVQTLPILTNFYIHAKHKHTLLSFKFITSILNSKTTGTICVWFTVHTTNI